METGKRICQALKELRKRIADANEIPFKIEECSHRGDCLGTCPKCEAELRYLMEAINKRGQEGKPVVIDDLMNDEELRQVFGIDYTERQVPELPDNAVLDGMPAPPEHILMGDVAAQPNYDFASTIAKALMAKTNGNIVFSPIGLCRILEILQEGMDTESSIYERVCELIDRFNSNIESVDEDIFKLEHASSIWYNKSLGTINEDYLDTLEYIYSAEAHHADFTQNKSTKLMIDKWASDNTHQKIKTLDTEINQDTLMLVLDAIYMNGKWENPFDPDYTAPDTFHNADGSDSDVDMMNQDIKDAAYSENDEYQLIHLPYRDGVHSMVLVLPKDGISIEDVMGRTDWIDQDTDVCEVDLHMPRFNFHNTLSYREILTFIGLGDMFERDDSFPNITDKPTYISQIKQQCVINVEEEGTEAAALTFADVEAGCPPPDDIPEPVTMILDRPFGFAIKGEYDQLLFMGILKQMRCPKCDAELAGKGDIKPKAEKGHISYTHEGDISSPHEEKKLFMECSIAGISFHDIDDIWDELQIGTKLALVREKNNAYDKNAVAVALAGDYDGNPDDFDFDFILGYIPRKDNEALAAMLDMGWEDMFETEICELNEHAPYSNRIHIAIYIKSKEIGKEEKEDDNRLRMMIFREEEKWKSLSEQLWKKGYTYFRWGGFPPWESNLPSKGDKVVFLYLNGSLSHLYLMQTIAVGDNEAAPFVGDIEELERKDGCTVYILTNIVGPIVMSTEDLQLPKGLLHGHWQPDELLPQDLSDRLTELFVDHQYSDNVK